jgi:hypothetical protein
MPDDENTQKDKQENDEQTPAATSFPLKPSGEVVVTHLDSPPPSGPRSIHPRRTAPIVPERRPQPPADEDEKK